MALGVSYSSAFEPERLASCCAHDVGNANNDIAMDLHKLLMQCIERTVLQNASDEMCSNAQAHWADVSSVQQGSFHVGYHSTAQIVANLLHMVVQLVSFPKPVCVQSQETQTDEIQDTLENDTSQLDFARTEGSLPNAGDMQDARRGSDDAPARRDSRGSMSSQPIQSDKSIQCDNRPLCVSSSVQCERTVCRSSAAQTQSALGVHQGVQADIHVDEMNVDGAINQVWLFDQETQTVVQSLDQEAQTVAAVPCESAVQTHIENHEADAQAELMCQHCFRNEAHTVLCNVCKALADSNKPKVYKYDASAQATELCHCCFRDPGKITFCKSCLKVSEFSPPGNINLCWECNLRIAPVKGGRCFECVKTGKEPPAPPNHAVRIGGGYDMLPVTPEDDAKVFAEAASKTVRPDHGRFAHGAPGPLSTAQRFHVGMVFSPMTSRKHSVEPELALGADSQRATSALEANGRSGVGPSGGGPSGASSRQRPKSALHHAVFRDIKKPTGEKAVERMLSSPRSCMWRVMVDNLPVRDPPPW
mmetsp:Transcript_82168/g.156062  ORF Transcript_82168/g.156062 Transcript_82168/m.156062 type:complete len:532 (-) Transcript_82168:112-1707(-)